jgi:hypothetical protein
VRLVGSTVVVNKSTGEVGHSYSSSQELDGTTYVRCGNRRAEVCPSCSAEYKGDAWHLILCGLAGGKGIPESVADHPCTFATFTAPSFGPVQGVRQKGPCRARRDKPVCEHGRPLCADCYDYTGHVVWQWHAPDLWRRFTITLQRDLARMCGLSVKAFRERCKVSYSKVVEFQARGLIHLHVPIRLDGPQGPDGAAPDLPIGTSDLETAIKTAAGKVQLDAAPLRDGTVYRLRWGSQVDTRSIGDVASRDSGRAARLVHPEQVAAYLAKYLTKATEDFGLPARVRSVGHARLAGASDHAIRIIETPRSSPLRTTPRGGCWPTSQPAATAGIRSPSPAPTRSPSARSAGSAAGSDTTRPAWTPRPTSARCSMSTTTSPKGSRSSPPGSS